jgi:hypothetical protein
MEDQIKDFATKNSSKVDLLPPPADIQKRLGDIRSFAEGEAKLYDEIAQRQLTVSQTEEANERAAIEKLFADRKISKEQYENENLAITEKYARKNLEIQAKWLEEEIKLLPTGTKGREDAEKKLADLHVLLNKRTLTDDQRTAQERARILEEYIQKAKGIASEVSDLIGGLINNSVTGQKTQFRTWKIVNNRSMMPRLQGLTQVQQQNSRSTTKLLY